MSNCSCSRQGHSEVSTCLLIRSWWATRPKRTGVSYSLLQDELETGYRTLSSTAINYKTDKKLIELLGETKSCLEANKLHIFRKLKMLSRFIQEFIITFYLGLGFCVFKCRNYTES